MTLQTEVTKGLEADIASVTTSHDNSQYLKVEFGKHLSLVVVLRYLCYKVWGFLGGLDVEYKMLSFMMQVKVSAGPVSSWRSGMPVMSLVLNGVN